MLDINLLRKDLEGVITRLSTRKNPQPFLDIDRFIALEAERKTLQTRTEELQAQRNQHSKHIGQRKAKGEDAADVMEQVAAIKVELDNSAARLEAIQDELHDLLMGVPNLPYPQVPVGADETGNVEVRRWGQPRAFDFAVRDHVDVGAALGLDFETGAKLSGARFTVLRGPLARLHRALAQFML
ncbi:MAG: serine--tRNA ligase, partial [Thiomonas sp. 14-66-4]